MRRGLPIVASLAWLAAAAVPVAADLQDAAGRARRTVWDGIYTGEQAERGKAAFMDSCASCHAEDLRGRGTAPSLVEESFAFQWSDLSVGELVERTRKLMPSDRPNSLSAQAYRDIVAFILQSNKFPAGGEELDEDPEALKDVIITAKPR